MFQRKPEMEFTEQVYEDLRTALKDEGFSFGYANQVHGGQLPCIFVRYEGIDAQHNNMITVFVVSNRGGSNPYRGNEQQMQKVLDVFQNIHYAIPIRAQGFHENAFIPRGDAYTGTILSVREA